MYTSKYSLKLYKENEACLFVYFVCAPVNVDVLRLIRDTTVSIEAGKGVGKKVDAVGVAANGEMRAWADAAGRCVSRLERLVVLVLYFFEVWIMYVCVYVVYRSNRSFAIDQSFERIVVIGLRHRG